MESVPEMRNPRIHVSGGNIIIENTGRLKNGE